jgi:pyruvate formate lyase activating enzyme
MMWYEFIMDFANSYPDVQIVIVTNGYLNEEPWKAMLNMVNAMNIDLKSVRNEFYKKVCNGDVNIVKRNIELAYSAGVHLELTYLLIPERNATDVEIDELAKYIASIDTKIPLHISAYHPAYKDTTRATSPNEVMHACDIAEKYLKHVYAGNVFIPKYSRR